MLLYAHVIEHNKKMAACWFWIDFDYSQTAFVILHHFGQDCLSLDEIFTRLHNNQG